VPHQTIRLLVALAPLGAVFLKGFKEAIGIAVFSVAAYLLLNSCAETNSDFKNTLTLAQVFQTGEQATRCKVGQRHRKPL
jgi:hypothetical protein